MEAAELERIDFEKYESAVRESTEDSNMISSAGNEYQLSDALDEILERREVETPWGNDIESYFNQHSKSASVATLNEGV